MIYVSGFFKNLKRYFTHQILNLRTRLMFFLYLRLIKSAEVKDDVRELDVGTWTLKGGLKLMDDLFPHVTGGLRGKQIKVASMHVNHYYISSF